jgi:hypothetical protein
MPNTAIKIHHIQCPEINTNVREGNRKELGSWYWQQGQWNVDVWVGCREVVMITREGK